MRSVTLYASLLLILLLAARHASAQVVTGRVVDAESGAPLDVAFVVLVGEDGGRDASALTDATGTFRLRASAPGRYRVRAERIGYAAAESETLEVTREAPVRVELSASPRAIDLEGIEVEGSSRCSVRPGEGEVTAQLWDEARRALSVTTWAQDEQVLQFRLVRWNRTLDPERLRVKEERRRPSTGFHGGSPFVSLPSVDLQARGYVQKAEDGSFTYYAPDPEVLLSDAFLDSHCFRTRLNDPPEEGWVGLGFEPVRRREVTDIHGVMWLDAATAELKRVEYRYDRLPAGLESEKVGGALEFDRIPEGPWIVRRWAIRMPVVGIREPQRVLGSTVDRRPFLAEVLEVGGEIAEIRTPEGSPLLRSEPAVLTGAVWDSVAAAPLVGAPVRLAGTAFTGVTDDRGRFRLEGLPEGSYTATFDDPRFDALGWTPEGVPVDLEPGRTSSVRLAVPPVERMLADACQAFVDEEGTAVLQGRVAVGGGGAAPAGTEVVLAWETASVRARGGGVGGGRVVDVEQGATDARITPGAGGRFVVCGLPHEEEIAVWGELFQRPVGDTSTVRLGRGEIRAIDVEIGSDVVALEGVDVNVTSSTTRQRRANASSANFRITAEEIEEAKAEGARDLRDVLTRVAPPSVSVSSLMRGPNAIGTCVETTRTTRPTSGDRACQAVKLYIDGIESPPSEAARYFESSHLLDEIGSIEFLSPSEATFRLGTGHSSGAILIRTRMGGG